MESNLPERVAVLETKLNYVTEQVDSIVIKLDSLLQLKSKGTGAIQLAGLILGSGVLGLIGVLVTMFSPKPHL
jgi:hypothetical protein